MTIQTDDFAPAPQRVVSAAPASPNEEAIERALRPKLLDEYVGQAKVREQLEIFIGAARKRAEALDHVLLFGPPGLGKTTLSHIIAAELGVNLRQTSGPVLEKPKDLAALLTNLERNDVLFIDEIHRLSPGGRGNPLPGAGGLPDRHHDRRGPGRAQHQARPAAVHAGRRHHARRHADQPAARPLRHRRAAGVLHGRGTGAHRARAAPACWACRWTTRAASRSRAARAARRASPTACCAACATTREVKGDGRITVDVAHKALAMLDVDPQGFDLMDRKLLEAVIHRFDGGPVGLDNVAASIGEESRHHRGRDRALPDPAGLPAAHAARAHRDAGGVPAPGRGAAAARRRHVRQLSRRAQRARTWRDQPLRRVVARQHPQRGHRQRLTKRLVASSASLSMKKQAPSATQRAAASPSTAARPMRLRRHAGDHHHVEPDRHPQAGRQPAPPQERVHRDADRQRRGQRAAGAETGPRRGETARCRPGAPAGSRPGRARRAAATSAARRRPASRQAGQQQQGEAARHASAARTRAAQMR